LGWSRESGGGEVYGAKAPAGCRPREGRLSLYNPDTGLVYGGAEAAKFLGMYDPLECWQGDILRYGHLTWHHPQSCCTAAAIRVTIGIPPSHKGMDAIFLEDGDSRCCLGQAVQKLPA
jgi:hypothetical protein